MRIGAVIACTTLVGCIHRNQARLGAEAPESSACLKLRLAHNAYTLSSGAASGLAGGAAIGAGLETQPNERTAQVSLGVTAGVLGVGAALLTAASGLTADDYARECAK
jgi:hypothetical protein